MGNGRKKVLASVVSAALAASLCALPATAYAAGGLSGTVGETTNWKVPTSQMTNTIVQGSGASQTPYKVITTWANAWALSGPDYLGVSNSGPLNHQGGGAGSTSLSNARNDTMLGIWASTANEVPNAYNWNYFYNLSLTEQGKDNVDWAAVDVQNGAAGGFDTESGVWAPFKYRPEVIWYSNSLNAATTATAVQYINEGKYFSAGAKVDEGTAVENATDYAQPGDATYNPELIQPNSGSPSTFLDSFYELATDVEKIEAQNEATLAAITSKTESGVTTYSSNGVDLYTITEKTQKDQRTGAETTSYTLDASNVNWKTANLLPRIARYETSSEAPMTARESALAIEKFVRGSVMYTLSAIDDGIVAKKKVAFLTGDPSNGTATVVKYDFIDGIGGGPTGGKTGVSCLAVESLTGTDEQRGEGANYATYTVTADDLAGCDYVVDANGSMTTNQIQSWVANNVSSAALKKRALNDVQYLTNSPAIMNGHNFTAEKLLWGGFNLDFFYPELFPNMELTTWWYDNVYHLKANNIKQAMEWGLANASLPAETDLASLGKGYSTADLDSKFKAGYDYFMGLADRSAYTATTSTTSAGVTTETVNTLEPSDDFKAWADGQTALKDTIVLSGTDSYEKVANDQAFELDVKSSIKGATLTYASSNEAVATVSDEGLVTIKGAGEAEITVTAAKDRYDAGTMTVKVSVSDVTLAENPMTVKAKAVSVKAGKSVALSKIFTVKDAVGDITYKKASGNKGFKVKGTKLKVDATTKAKAKPYKIKISVTASGDDATLEKTITKAVKVTVKK